MLRLKRLLHLPPSTFPSPVTVSRLLSNAPHDVSMIPVNHKEIRSVSSPEPIVLTDSLHPTLPCLSLGKIGYIHGEDPPRIRVAGPLLGANPCRSGHGLSWSSRSSKSCHALVPLVLKTQDQQRHAVSGLEPVGASPGRSKLPSFRHPPPPCAGCRVLPPVRHAGHSWWRRHG